MCIYIYIHLHAFLENSLIVLLLFFCPRSTHKTTGSLAVLEPDPDISLQRSDEKNTAICRQKESGSTSRNIDCYDTFKVYYPCCKFFCQPPQRSGMQIFPQQYLLPGRGIYAFPVEQICLTVLICRGPLYCHQPLRNLGSPLSLGRQPGVFSRGVVHDRFRTDFKSFTRLNNGTALSSNSTRAEPP